MAYDYQQEDGVYKVFKTKCRTQAVAICDDLANAEMIVNALNENKKDLISSLFKIGGS